MRKVLFALVLMLASFGVVGAAATPSVSAYTNCGTGFTHTNESAWAVCSSGGGAIKSWQGWVVCSSNPGTKYYGPRVAGIGFSSQVWCPAGVVIQNGGLWYL